MECWTANRRETHGWQDGNPAACPVRRTGAAGYRAPRGACRADRSVYAGWHKAWRKPKGKVLYRII